LACFLLLQKARRGGNPGPAQAAIMADEKTKGEGAWPKEADFGRILARAPKDLVKTLDDEILRIVASRKASGERARKVGPPSVEEGGGRVRRFD